MVHGHERARGKVSWIGIWATQMPNNWFNHLGIAVVKFGKKILYILLPPREQVTLVLALEKREE